MSKPEKIRPQLGFDDDEQPWIDPLERSLENPVDIKGQIHHPNSFRDFCRGDLLACIGYSRQDYGHIRVLFTEPSQQLKCRVYFADRDCMHPEGIAHFRKSSKLFPDPFPAQFFWPFQVLRDKEYEDYEGIDKTIDKKHGSGSPQRHKDR
jgi:hypothetical protein